VGGGNSKRARKRGVLFLSALEIGRCLIAELVGTSGDRAPDPSPVANKEALGLYLLRRCDRTGRHCSPNITFVIVHYVARLDLLAIHFAGAVR